MYVIPIPLSAFQIRPPQPPLPAIVIITIPKPLSRILALRPYIISLFDHHASDLRQSRPFGSIPFQIGVVAAILVRLFLVTVVVRTGAVNAGWALYYHLLATGFCVGVAIAGGKVIDFVGGGIGCLGLWTAITAGLAAVGIC